ncbi:hypothetical protein GCM10025870_15490 [Agromyces marinus]|uniref:HEAT repeat domain-containing protein n=1 Tax=Agromyces marinus TaxID=1389020 RepID=A0ABM8H122_9MICO|nr:hypothetical protein [Agromyces marinus]BDZ54476.1 hypothetical protein GCM10025870_15490 [Agromyces marinus]
MGIQTALDSVAHAPTIVDAMRAADDLAFEAARDPGARTLRILDRAMSGQDELVVVGAVHALAGVLDDEAGRILVRLLSDERRFVREHAAWALGSGLPRSDAVGRLLAMVVEGGFAGMLAQRTLEHWSGAIATALAIGIEERCSVWATPVPAPGSSRPSAWCATRSQTGRWCARPPIRPNSTPCAPPRSPHSASGPVAVH